MKKYLFLTMLVSVFASCQNTFTDNAEKLTPNLSSSVIQQDFDWETSDYMPTPKGYEAIPTPWNGSGSLAGTYDLDVLNNRKKSEGWTLVYNTFTTDVSKYTPNPYFVIYNKYNGILRIFYYVTSDFITTSSNVVDNFYISSSHTIRMFDFADNAIVDGNNSRKELNHIQPKSSDNSKPVSSHRWYMAQYELAYDPNIASIPYNQVMLDFNLNYKQLSSIKLNGTLMGDVKGTIGEQSQNEFSNAFTKTLETGGKAALSNITYGLLKKAQKTDSGENSLGINKNLFNNIMKNVGKLASSSMGNFCGAAFGLFSSLFGGTRTSSTPFSANINTKLNLTGEIQNEGSFPSMPITMYMPGTNIPSNAVGAIPLYNKPLGVFNISKKPTIYLAHSIIRRNRHDDPYNPGMTITETTEELSCGQTQSFAPYLVFNPEVEKMADISVVKEQLFALDENGHYYTNREFSAYSSGETGAPIETIPNVTYYVYFTIEVKPKDGTPASYISKTFQLDNQIHTTETWLPDL